MRTRIVGLVVAASIAGFGVVASSHAGQSQASRSALKPCSSGWSHAIIDAEHKCLRAGQFARETPMLNTTPTAFIATATTQAQASTG